MTEAETALWIHLKAGINGLKFRRQHPIGVYIADFYCHKVKLIIEIDGGIHNDPKVKKADKQKEMDLKNWGYMIIRFSNDDVLTNSEKILKEIEIIISKKDNIRKQNTLRKAESKSPL
jgi:very-short-patch-repair endonuclease